MENVTFNISGVVVSIDDKEYMKGDLWPKLSGDGYSFYSRDPLQIVHNWIPFHKAIDGAAGDPFASLAAFTTWVTDNMYVPGEGGAPATVEDGSITEAKLAAPLAAKIDGATPDSDFIAHTGNTSNPHLVTPAQIGAATVGLVASVSGNLTTHEAAIGAGNHLPTGGTSGQIVVKGSGTDTAWADAPTAASLGAVLVGGQASVSGLVMGTHNAQDVTIVTNGDNRIVIDSIGNVGIGVTDPQAPLDIAGGFLVSAGSVHTEWNPVDGTDLTLGTSSAHPVNLIADGTAILTLNVDGSVTAAGSLHINDGAVFTGGAVVDHNDLSKHINLYGGTYGINITSYAMNFNMDSDDPKRKFNFWEGSTLVGVIEDPIADSKALITKEYFDTNKFMAAMGSILTADATDPATTMALVNECKAMINSLLTNMRDHGLLAT